VAVAKTLFEGAFAMELAWEGTYRDLADASYQLS
jgi:hypothetical protein